MERSKPQKLSTQVKQKVRTNADNKVKEDKPYEGNTSKMISTGSTLLDLAISGGRVRGGGIPGGIFVEIFGPSGAGKTVLLCEIAGAVQRKGGEIMFRDPEARLNKQFAQMFDLDTDAMTYDTPDTVPEIFAPIITWEPEPKKVIHGIFADSLAALSTDMEMDNDAGDKMGMRRSKEFSEGLRKTCRILAEKNYLMVCSNQVRVNVEAQAFQEKYTSPGGLAVGFYASLRLRASMMSKIMRETTFAGKKIKKPIGIRSEITVHKSSVWKPYLKAPITILFDYGIDDIRENLQFIKDYSKNTVYSVGGDKLSNSLEAAIELVEEEGLEKELKNEVIDLWEEIDSKFSSNRKTKKR